MPTISLFGSAASVNVIIAFLFGLVLLYLLFRLILVPFRSSGRVLMRVGVSALCLVAVNLIGGRFGYAVPLNLVTVLIPALLGVPGFFLATLMQFLIF